MPTPRGFCPFPEGTPHGSAQPLVQGCGELLGGSPGSLRGLKVWKKFIWSSNFMLITMSGCPWPRWGAVGWVLGTRFCVLGLKLGAGTHQHFVTSLEGSLGLLCSPPTQ